MTLPMRIALALTVVALLGVIAFAVSVTAFNSQSDRGADRGRDRVACVQANITAPTTRAC